MPHPPVVVPGVGRGREREALSTVQAMHALAERVMKSAPEGLVLISPHSPRRPGAFGIWKTRRLSGSLVAFGAPEERVELPVDKDFIRELESRAGESGLSTWDITRADLDHGALVPLCYLARAGWKGPTVVLSLNYPGEGGLVELGRAITATAGFLGRRIAIIASGDMSHRLQPGAPSGYHPQAHLFDETFVQLVRAGAYQKVARFDEELQELAGEDVVDSTVIAMAAVEFDPTCHEVLSYEGPFGVGYCVAVLYQRASEGGAGVPLEGTMGEHGKARSTAPSGEILPAVARQTVEEGFVGRSEDLGIELTSYLNQRRGVFVTIRTKNGELRGCKGNITPVHGNLVEATKACALSAAFDDARFESVTRDELSGLTYEVSVLHAPEPVASTAALDPAVYGIILTAKDGRRALMLPGIPELDTVAKQLAATRRKARIEPGEPVDIQRFTVEKFGEKADA